MRRGFVIGLVIGGLVASFGIAVGDTASSTECFECDGTSTRPVDYKPLYGLIPVAGNWIGFGRTAANFPQDRRSGFSDAAMAAEVMPYLMPATVELVGLTLLVVGLLADRRHR